ncbi:MAG: phage shock protein PspA [Deltaproteobacteria bacterium]|nr:phage shock protein PspA [Deltaproteobacteria bacterium]
MGIFTRLSDIVSSNISSMLDKAEDPEKLIRLMIQEMEDTLVEIKVACAQAMAARKKVERELDEARRRGDQWEEKAKLAVAKGREDLAREALVEKRRYRERAEVLEDEAVQCAGVIEQYQSDMVQLEDKLAKAHENQRILVQRHIQAHKRKRAQSGIRKMTSADTMLRFEQFENRIERMEAEADLVNFAHKPDLDDVFARLEQDEEIEAELRRLKDGAGRSET